MPDPSGRPGHRALVAVVAVNAQPPVFDVLPARGMFGRRGERSRSWRGSEDFKQLAEQNGAFGGAARTAFPLVNAHRAEVPVRPGGKGALRDVRGGLRRSRSNRLFRHGYVSLAPAIGQLTGPSAGSRGPRMESSAGFGPNGTSPCASRVPFTLPEVSGAAMVAQDPLIPGLAHVRGSKGLGRAGETGAKAGDRPGNSEPPGRNSPPASICELVSAHGFPEFLPERLAVDLKDLGGPCLVAADAGEHVADILGLHVRQGPGQVRLSASGEPKGLR